MDESATEVHHGIVTGEPVQETAVSSGSSNSTDVSSGSSNSTDVSTGSSNSTDVSSGSSNSTDVSTGSSNSTDGEDEERRIKNLLHMKFNMAKEALASGDKKKATEDLDVAVHFVEDLLRSPDLALSVVQDIQDLLVVTFKKQVTEAQTALDRNELQIAAVLASAADKTFRVYDLHFPHILPTHEYLELEEKAHSLKKIQLEIAETQGNILETVKCLYHLVLYGIDPSYGTQLVGLCQTMIISRIVLPKFKSDLKELVIWLEKQGKDLLKSNRPLSYRFCEAALAIMKCCPDLPDKSRMNQVMCSVCFMLSFHLFSDYSVDPNPDILDRITSYSKEGLKDHSSYDYKPALFYWTWALKGQRKFQVALRKALEYQDIKRKPGMTEAENKLLDVMDKDMQSLISELKDEMEGLKSEQADPDWIDQEYHQTGPEKVKQKVLNKRCKHVRRRRQTSRRHSECTELEESNVQSTPQVDIRASTRNDISGQKKYLQDCKGDDQEKTVSASTGTSIHSLLESTNEAVSKSCKGRSTSSSMPELGKKISRKKEDSNGLENIFSENTFYAKSVKILNETKNNFVSDLLRDQEVLTDDKSHVMYNKNNDHEKVTIYQQRSPHELRDLLKLHPKSHKLCTMSIYSSQKAHCRLVDPEGDSEAIEINGRTRCGQAFSKDKVVVKLLGNKTRNDATIGEVLGVLLKHSRAKHPVFICQADSNCPHKLMKPQCKTVPKVKVLRPPNWRKPPSEGNPANFDIAIYNIRNGKIQFIRWKSLLWSDCNKYLYWVAYLDWRDDKLFPLGVVVHITDLQAASEVERMDMLLSGATVQHKIKLLYDHTTLEQTRQILDNAHTDVWKSKETMERRTNLVDKLKVFTIDPVGSKDLDDALSLEVNSDGTLSLGVHIADVSAFVKKDDPIDKEAFKRRTSHYPPGKVPIHMLPDPMITDLLSLAEGKNRLALSLIFTFYADGSRVKGRACTILKTVVKSRKQYTYQEVQSIINTHGGSTDIATLEAKIMKLLQIAMKLRKERLGNGWYHQTLDWLEDDMSTWEAHCLVEELMFLANKEVASFLLNRFPDCTPLRCPKSPSDEQIEKFRGQFSPELTGIMSYLQQFIYFGKHKDAGDGESANAGIRREISHIPIQKFVWQLLSAAIEAKDSKRIASIMHLENLHPSHALAMYEWITIQTPAEFRCSSDSNDLSNLRHFALGNILYAQFTSPIRRYLDLVVHRLVHNALSGTCAEYKPYNLQMICESVNEMQSVAKSYEKYCKSVKLAITLQKEPLNVAGIIVSVTEEKVELLNPFAQQRIEKVFDLNFSKLGVYSQPELHNPDDPSEGVTLTWKKRLYDARGTHPHAKPALKPNMRKAIGLQVSKLDPSYSVTQINLADWKSLEDFVSKRKKKLGTIYPKAPADGTVIDVTSEVRDGELLDQHCSFSLSLKRGQCISVQLSAKQTSGLYQPEVQLCTIAPSVSLCMLHMDDPVQMFTRPARYAAKAQYQSLEQYKKIWIPILDMELAESIIKDPEETIIINNVKVALAKPNEREESSSNSIKYTGTLSLQPWFCDNRCIFLDPSKEEQEGGGFITDYLCLRYTPCAEPLRQLSKLLPVSQTIKETLRAQTTWIGHGQVENVASGQDDRRLTFKLNHLTQQPPEEMFNKAGVPCTIELLRKSPGDRRIEEALSDLEEGSLAASLAKGYGATSPSKKMKIQRQIISKMKSWMLQKTRELNQYGLDLSMWDVKGQWFPGNNNNQREAIEKAIRSDFSIIHGPPGTGKTFTAIKLVYFFVLINKFTQEFESKDGAVVRPRQVLFCGPSNSSVDVVANYLMKKLKTKCPRIIRVYGETIESKEYPKPTKWISPRLASCRAVCDPELKEIALHHLIRRPGAKYSAEIKQYDNFIKSSPKVAWKKRKVISKLLFKASIDELKECDVILCTATSSSCPRIVKATNIFQCIVDECGMCPEPECLVPLVSSKAEQVVLIGDHKQLQPIISCKDAARLGLQKSLFERYAEMLEKQELGVANYTMLNIQYRMHPSICDFPSKEFYDHKLVTGASSSWVEESPLPIWLGRNGSYMVTGGSELTYPPRVVFCHVEGKEETLQVSTEDGNENSKSNKVECEHVVRIVHALTQQWKVDPRHINVMSQYNAQCTLLKKGLLKFYHSLNVKTVVASQGGEWDYVVFSMVRSLPEYLIDPHPTLGWNQENLGFITDVHQVNVALTRAKKGLILLGNRNLLKCDRVLERLFEDYEKRGCIVPADKFLPPRDLKQIPQPVGPVVLPRRRNAQPVQCENQRRRSVDARKKPLQPLWKNASSSTPYRWP